MENDGIISFQEALDDSLEHPRVLLLGNGFSRAYFDKGNDDPFSWTSLGKFLAEELQEIPVEAFQKEFSKDDLEFMVRKLQQAKRVAQCYGLDLEGTDEKGLRISTLGTHAENLKEGLVLAVASNHPDTPDQEKLRSCLKFLGHFIPIQGNTGSIFTLSYDQLLNWASLASPGGNPSTKNKLNKDDGFRAGGKFTGKDEIRLHYLHGSLHLWSRAGEPFKLKGTGSQDEGRKGLINSIRAEFKTGSGRSLTVVGGTVDDKKKAIADSPYLTLMHDRFKNKLTDKDSSLFVYGVSFDTNDQHVFDAVRESNVGKIYISTREKVPSSALQDKAALIKESRRRAGKDNVPQVFFFDAADARPWG